MNDKLCRPNCGTVCGPSYCGAGCGPSYSGAGRAAGQVTAGRGGLRAKLLRGGAGYNVAKNVRCGLTAGQVTAGRGELRAMMWQILRCGLTAGQVTAGRGGLRAQISSPRRALIYTQQACTNCAKEYLTARHRGHLIKLMTWHSWIHGYKYHCLFITLARAY